MLLVNQRKPERNNELSVLFESEFHLLFDTDFGWLLTWVVLGGAFSSGKYSSPFCIQIVRLRV